MPFTGAHDTELFSGSTHVASGDAEAYLKAHSSIFANGTPDVIIIGLEAGQQSAEVALAGHDALISRVTRAVDSGSRGNYVALLTAARDPEAERRRLAADLAPAYLHTSPTLLTAQLVMLILMVIFLSGFCCLFSLQTPKRFEESKEH